MGRNLGGHQFKLWFLFLEFVFVQLEQNPSFLKPYWVDGQMDGWMMDE